MRVSIRLAIVSISAGVLFGTPLFAYAALSDGLVGYWSMDETSGTRADATGNGNDLTPVGTVGYKTGKIGNSVSVGGVSGDFDNMLEHAGFNLGADSFTATVWIPGIDEATVYLTGGYFVYITDSSESDIEADLEWNPSRISAYINGWSSPYLRPAYSPSRPETAWDFVTVEWDKDAGLLKVKINNGAWTSVAQPSNHIVASSNLYVGAYAAANDPVNWPARIDEMGLWNRALSDGEVTSLYNSGSGMSYADILATGATPTPTPASGGHTNVGTLIVQKVLIGNDPSIDADDFSYTLDNEPDRFDDETGAKTYIRPVGMHTVHEDAFPGYTTTYSGDCDASGNVTVAQDVTRTCIITNTAIPPVPGASATPTPFITPEPWEVTPGGTLEGTDLHEGDTVSAVGSNDPDVYIVNVFGYKRLFLNPVIFSFYGHLGGFSKVKTITPQIRDSFGTSGLFRNCETNDQAVYGVETTGEDTGILHHINITGDAAVAQDPDFFKKVFCINTKEFDWYAKGADYTSLSQVPRYRR